MLTAFRFSFPIQVRFRDLDLLGHVNNAVYLTYFESARIAYWMRVTRRGDLKDLAMILARVEVDFRSPAAYGETLDIGVRCSALGRSSFTLEFRMAERASSRLVAEARKVLVHYDFSLGRSLPLGDELRQLILAHDPDAQGP
jgi:acyl-CoA thioester hydrolase